MDQPETDERSVPSAEPAPTAEPSRAPLSIPDYARHRRINRNQINAAIDDGRLVASIVKIGGRWFIRDAAEADAEWTANTRPKLPSGERSAATEQIGEAGTTSGYRAARESLATAQAAREAANAEIAQLNLAKRRGELIETAQARADVVDLLTAVKTKLLGIPMKIGQQLPGLGPAGVKLIDELVRESLEDLADELAPE